MNQFLLSSKFCCLSGISFCLDNTIGLGLGTMVGSFREIDVDEIQIKTEPRNLNAHIFQRYS